MTWEALVQYLIDNALKPALLALIPVVMAYGKKLFDQIVSSQSLKNKADALKTEAEALSTAYTDIRDIVRDAVIKGMDLVKAVRTAKGLPEEAGVQIKADVTEMVWNMLPPSVKEGKILQLIGGKAVLDALIDSMIESQLTAVKSENPQKSKY